MADEPFPFPVRWTLTEAVVWIMTRNQDAVDWSRHALWSPLPAELLLTNDLQATGIQQHASLSHAMSCLRFFLLDGLGHPTAHTEGDLADVAHGTFAASEISANLAYGLHLDNNAYRERQILVDRECIQNNWPAPKPGRPTEDDRDDVLTAASLMGGLDPLTQWGASLKVARARHTPGNTVDPADAYAKRINRKLAERGEAGEHLAAVADTACDLIASGIGTDHALLRAAKLHPAIGKGGNKLLPDAELAAIAKQWLSQNSG